MAKKIVILQGVPGSGKSTYARQLVEKDKSYVIVNRDDIRMARGDYWVPEQEDYISDIEEFEVRSAIKHGLNPIIDATNLNPKTIAKWKKIADENNLNVEERLFIIDYKTALERDAKRSRTVGEKVIKGFFQRYFPELLKRYYTDARIRTQTFAPDTTKEEVIIADLDGTVCLHDGRSPFEYVQLATDKPNQPLIKILQELNKEYKILFVTGREDIDFCREDTISWLNAYFKETKGWELFMRKAKDHRPDEIVKKEIYQYKIEPKYSVISVFEDRDKVVKMWRELGLLCNQVYWGDF